MLLWAGCWTRGFHRSLANSVVIVCFVLYLCELTEGWNAVPSSRFGPCICEHRWSVGMFPAGVILITWAMSELVQFHIPSPPCSCSSPRTASFLADLGSAKGSPEPQAAQKPDEVLSANSSSSVNIRPVGVALLLFVYCTNYVHVLMGFWRILFMQSGSGHTGHLCCVVCLFRTWGCYSEKKK